LIIDQDLQKLYLVSRSPDREREWVGYARLTHTSTVGYNF
jgi:hypothetical protein